MKPVSVLLLSATLLAVAGSGCTTIQPAQQAASQLPAPDETGSAACFFRRLVASFHALDDSNLIVFAPGRSDAYHVRIEPPASAMAAATALAFTSRSNRVCGAEDDAVFFEDSRRAPRYSIIAVSRLSESTLTELIELAYELELEAAARGSDPG